MDRRKRNRLCIWLIILGLGNFIIYGVIYAIIGGDAPNGDVRQVAGRVVYSVRGHFVHRGSGVETEVPRWVWIYSWIHSITIWPSIAAVLLAMLLLARPHIMATYQHGRITGTTLVTVMATVIVIVVSIIMIAFVVDFIRALARF